MGLKNDQQGFTLISLLLTLMIIMISMPIITFLIQYIQVNKDDTHISAHQFFHFIYTDSLKATDVYVDDNHIYFVLNEDEIATIELYQHLIRRRVSGKGHEIYLEDVKEMKIESKNFGFRILLTMDNGEIYEKTIAYTKK